MKLTLTMERDVAGDTQEEFESSQLDVEATFAARLRMLADRLDGGSCLGNAIPVPIKDLNGNTIGEYVLSAVEWG